MINLAASVQGAVWDMKLLNPKPEQQVSSNLCGRAGEST